MKQAYKLLVCINIFISTISSAFAAVDYPAFLIPDSLKESAFSVIRSYDIVCTQTSMTDATYKITKIVTILDRRADNSANFSLSGDKFHDLSSFSGTISDAMGKVVKKIKKSDLSISTMNLDGYTFSTDDYTASYECKYPTYPFTVEYTYEVKMKNGILSYPVFRPYSAYYESVENATFQLAVPSSLKIRIKNDGNIPITESQVGSNNVYSISLKNLKSIPSEPYAPFVSDFIPSVMFGLSDFCYDSHCGNMDTWKNYGLWVNGLLKDNDKLSPEFVAQIVDMTKNAKNDTEKIKILYEYLQKNTRYVSIQLGIGGFQPIPADKVYKTKFGDCKALSNYMLAMLKSIGITSYYCEIKSGKSDYLLYPDFANVSQTNHAILFVPQKNDSIWLECTSSTTPFGFVHDNISGHDALVISDEGGKLCRLPSYPDKENKSVSNLIVKVGEDGSAKAECTFTDYLFRYDNNSYFFSTNDRDVQIKYLDSNLKLPKVLYGNIVTSENKSAMPSGSMKVSIEAPDFANKTGNRLFIPICPLAKLNSGVFSAATRKLDIQIQEGYSEIDTIEYIIPENYAPESLPKDILLETPFGKLSTQIKVDGNKITYVQEIDVFTGKYSKDKYNEIKDFFSQISTAAKKKLVLKSI